MKDEMVNLGERLENSLENVRRQTGESDDEKGELQNVTKRYKTFQVMYNIIRHEKPCLTTFPNTVRRVKIRRVTEYL